MMSAAVLRGVSMCKSTVVRDANFVSIDRIFDL